MHAYWFHFRSINFVMLHIVKVVRSILIIQRFQIHVLMDLIEKIKVIVSPFMSLIFLEMTKNPY